VGGGKVTGGRGAAVGGGKVTDGRGVAVGGGKVAGDEEKQWEEKK
jgi:hypothetical protein